MALMLDYVFVSKQNSVHLHFLGENILFNFYALGISTHIAKFFKFGQQ